jgi:hypothetical protein
MTKTHRENIPFFNELPVKAIPAAARLWDAIQNPGYNGAAAYNDFVQDLTFQGIAAPPRGVVRRWVSGVQGGLFNRPGWAAPDPVKVEPPSTIMTAPGYFDTLPATATPALQAAWDRASVDGFSDAFLLSSFTTELAAIGHAPPTKVQFAQWLKAVRAGEIGRPGKPLSDDGPAFEKLTPDTFNSSFDRLREAGVTPMLLPVTSIEFIDLKPDAALVMIRDRMVEEMVAQLTANARAMAEAAVAARFRQIADTMALAS